MIKLGFDLAVAILLSVLVLFVFGIWLRERGRRDHRDEDDFKHMRQCPYCRHMCGNDLHRKIMICPVCKSYFEEDGL